MKFQFDKIIDRRNTGSMKWNVQPGELLMWVVESNVFASIAPIAAFTCGAEWLEALREYLWENRRLAEDYINREIKGISVVS